MRFSSAEQVDELVDQDAGKKEPIIVTATPDDGKAVSISSISGGGILTTPAVRRLAAKHNINLRKVKGTGKDGRLLKEDVLRYIENQQSSTKDPVSILDESRSTKDMEIRVPTASSQSAEAARPIFSRPMALESDKTEPIRGIQKAMTKTMTRSLNIPHFGLCDEVDVTQLYNLRKSLKSLADERGVQLSFMPFVSSSF